MSAIPAYAILIGTGVILTYLPKVLSGAMDSIGGAAGFKRAAIAVAGAAITGGSSMVAGAAAKGAGSVAAGAAGRAAAAGNMTKAARMTRVASLSNRVAERTENVTKSSFRQLSNTFKDEAGLGGLTPLPYDDISFRGGGRPSDGGGAGAADTKSAPYTHTGPHGVEEGHLHNEVFTQGNRAIAADAKEASQMPSMAGNDAQRYVKAYKAKSLGLQDESDRQGNPMRTDPRTPVASPLHWKEAVDKGNPAKRTSYYEAPKVQKNRAADLDNSKPPGHG